MKINRNAYFLNRCKLLFIIMYVGVLHSQALACEYASVTFLSDFPGSHLNHCERISDSHFLLSFEPENRPINSSPWYAFKVQSKVAQALTLELEFDGDFPRYLPKTSRDGKTWQNIPFNATQRSFTIDINVDSDPLWVAGQEVIDNDYYTQWLSGVQVKNVDNIKIGTSTLGHDIHALESKSQGSKEWILLIGRQHPPEITGALAMRAFVDNLLKESTLAKAFRQRFNLLIVPNLNPDGVKNGHWRHNSQGVDLNRDWNKFEQKETQVVRDYLIKHINNQQKLVMGLDFHSTKEDVFYTIPADAGIAPANLVDEWLNDVQQQSKNIFKVRIKPGNAPGRGVFKQFIADTYKVHGVTYEMGDSTDRNLINQMAIISSEKLMEKLLDTPAADFYLEQGQ